MNDSNNQTTQKPAIINNEERPNTYNPQKKRKNKHKKNKQANLHLKRKYIDDYAVEDEGEEEEDIDINPYTDKITEKKSYKNTNTYNDNAYDDDDDDDIEDYETAEDRNFIASEDEYENISLKNISNSSQTKLQYPTISKGNDNEEKLIDAELHERYLDNMQLESAKKEAERYDKLQSEEYERNIREEINLKKSLATTRSTFIPSSKDPKLYYVRCGRGKEMKILYQLYQQLRISQITSQPFNIYSIFTNPTANGVIYIEAFTSNEVQKLCYTVNGIRTTSIQLVPIQQMTSSLHISDYTIENISGSDHKVYICNNTFVRIRTGIYKNDLALVYRILDGGRSAIVVMIPRFDYDINKVDSNNEQLNNKKKISKNIQNTQRPKPEKLNIQKLQREGINYQRTVGKGQLNFSTFTIIRSQHFFHGLLFRVIPCTSVIVDLQLDPPTLREIELFRTCIYDYSANESYDIIQRRIVTDLKNILEKASSDERYIQSTDDLLSNTSNSNSNTKNIQKDAKGQYAKGDKVIVIRGDLKSLIGEVLSIQDDFVTVKPTNIEDLDPQEFRKDELRKQFKHAQRVLIIDGIYKGNTGIIIYYDDVQQMLEIILDSTKKRINIQYENVINHDTPIYSNDTIQNRFKLYDMVIVQNQPGCIVCLTSTTARILFIDNTTQIVNLALLQPRILPKNAKQISYDCDNTIIQIDDLVIPLSWEQLQAKNSHSITPNTIAIGNTDIYAGKMCRVKHIIQSKLFVHNDNIKNMYGGVFVVDSFSVYKFITKELHDDKDGNTSNILRTIDTRNDPLRGKYVLITHGPQKGLTAKVDSVQSGDRLKLILPAKATQIQISRSHVQVISKPSIDLSSSSLSLSSSSSSSLLPSTLPILSQPPPPPLLGILGTVYNDPIITAAVSQYENGSSTPILESQVEQSIEPQNLEQDKYIQEREKEQEQYDVSVTSSIELPLPFWVIEGAVARYQNKDSTNILDVVIIQTVPNTIILPVQIQDSGLTIIPYTNSNPIHINDINTLSPYIPRIPNVTTVTSLTQQDGDSIQIGKLLSIDDSGQVLQELLHGDIEMVTLDQLCLYYDNFQALQAK